jgi:hypothetical protein
MVALAAVVGAGCPSTKTPDESGDVTASLAFTPAPPRVGPAEAVVELRDRQNQPVTGAAVKLEGNMNHAGMEPVFADAKETAPGRYTAGLTFTMGGDWFVLIDATLPDGRKVSRKVDVPGVKRGE